MKAKNILKESLIWLIIAIPFVYYALVYPKLPAQIPIHFDIHGTPDNYAPKASYWWLIAATTLGMYALLLIIPLIDPKRKIRLMGNKYFMIKLLLVLLMSLMTIFSIYVASKPQIEIKFILALLLGVMILIIGNYMPSFKPNYFIGIRTPWTLESEEIWRKTHRLGGWLWAITGLVIIVLSLMKVSLTVSIILLILAGLVPVLYSFILYLEQKKD